MNAAETFDVKEKIQKLEDKLSISCGENLSIEIYLVTELASPGDGDKIIRKALERQYKHENFFLVVLLQKK
jgi:hypothetical protein